MTQDRDGAATRDRIIDVVREDPGVHKSELCRRLGLGWGTVSYHVRVLEKERRLRSWSRGREVHVFPARVPDGQMRWLAALREGMGTSIVETLVRMPDARVKELSGSLGVSRKVIQRHLTVLDEAGVVRHDGSHQPRYRIEDDTVAALRRLLTSGPGLDTQGDKPA